MDIYYKEGEKPYYLVGVKQSDVKCENGKNVIDEEAYARRLLDERMIEIGQTRLDLEKLGYTFKLSFYENDIIEYEKDGKVFRERFLSRNMPQKRNYIEVKPLDRAKYDERKPEGLAKTQRIVKYRMDILGNYYLCEKEKFSRYC